MRDRERGDGESYFAEPVGSPADEREGEEPDSQQTESQVPRHNPRVTDPCTPLENVVTAGKNSQT